MSERNEKNDSRKLKGNLVKPHEPARFNGDEGIVCIAECCVG